MVYLLNATCRYSTKTSTTVKRRDEFSSNYTSPFICTFIKKVRKLNISIFLSVLADLSTDIFEITHCVLLAKFLAFRNSFKNVQNDIHISNAHTRHTISFLQHRYKQNHCPVKIGQRHVPNISKLGSLATLMLLQRYEGILWCVSQKIVERHT